MSLRFSNPRNREKALYFNKGFSRRQQIANWVLEEINLEGKLIELQRIKALLMEDLFKRALNQFENLVFGLSNEILVYLIRFNMQQFGRNTILIDLINRLIKVQKRVTKDRVIKSKQIPFKEFEKKFPEKKRQEDITERKIFGIDKVGNRRQATLDILVIKGVPVQRLRDIKTGRLLKSTKTFKKRVEKFK